MIGENIFMGKNREQRLAERTKKLVEFSKKAPFFTSQVGLLSEAAGVLFSELNYRLLFFSFSSEEFGYPKVYNFEGKELVKGISSCKCFSKSEIIKFTELLNTFNEPTIIPGNRIENRLLDLGLELPEFKPEAALTAPIKDRFDEKLGFMFLCSENEQDTDDLEFFSNIAAIVGIGLSILEKLENDDSLLEEHVAESPIGFLKISYDFKFITVNDSFARMLGFDSAEQFLSDENQIFVKRLERSRNIINALTRLKNSDNFTLVREMQAIDKYRNKIWLELHARYHISAIPSKDFFEVLAIDITDFKKLEKEFSNMLILQDSLFNLSKDGIVLEDEKGTILGINNVLTERYGKSADFLIGKHISVLGGAKRTIHENIRKLQDGEPHVQTIEHLTPDGKRYFYELSERLITFPDGNKKIVSYSRDITKEVGFEEKIIKLKSDLQSFKEFQTLFVSAISEKRTEFLELINNNFGLLEKLLGKVEVRKAIEKLDFFREDIFKNKITIDLLTAINSALLDKTYYKNSSFELYEVIKNEFIPKITKHLNIYGTTLNCNISELKLNPKLETEKEVLLNLLEMIIGAIVKNKSYNRLDFQLIEGKDNSAVIEIVIDENVLSTELLGKVFTPPASGNEYFVKIPKLFSLAERSELILQSGEKTKIKLIIT